MQHLTDKQIHDRIEEHDPKLAKEFMRRVNRPQPVDMDLERYVDRLQRDNERLTLKARAMNEGVV